MTLSVCNKPPPGTAAASWCHFITEADKCYAEPACAWVRRKTMPKWVTVIETAKPDHGSCECTAEKRVSDTAGYCDQVPPASSYCKWVTDAGKCSANKDCEWVTRVTPGNEKCAALYIHLATPTTSAKIAPSASRSSRFKTNEKKNVGTACST